MQRQDSFDAAYVQRLKDGDFATEDHFFKYFGELIRLKAGSRLRNGTLVDDIRQETLFRVIRTIRQGGIEQPERLGAFVNTVCTNVIYETIRRESRVQQIPEGTREVPSEDFSTEQQLLREERQGLVRDALNLLAPRDQALLHRIFYKEEDKDKVCKEFHVNREYLRVLLHRARTRLRSAMANE